MTDHHHPESTRFEPPTAKQQRYLRILADRKGTTFTVPKTKAEASGEIRRLQRLPDAPRSDRRRDDRDVSHALATSSTTARRIREDHRTTTGHGATARWS